MSTAPTVKGAVRRVVVDATTTGVSVGRVKAGSSWRLSAEGRWGSRYLFGGPEGQSSFLLAALGVQPEFDGAPVFCLLGRLDGQSGTTFPIGRDKEITFATDGELVVFPNRLQGLPARVRGSVELVAESTRGSRPPPLRNRWATWHEFRNVVGHTKSVVFLGLLSCFATFALMMSPQGPDLLRGGVTSGKVIFLCTLVLFGIQSWFWTRAIVIHNYTPDVARWPLRRLLLWGPRLLAALPFAAILYGMVQADGAATASVALTAVVLLGLVLALIVRADLASYLNRRTPRGASRRQRPWRRAWVILSLTLSVAATGLAAMAPVTAASMLGPMGTVFLALSLLIPFVALASQSRVGRVAPFFLILFNLVFVFGLLRSDYPVGRRSHSPEVNTPAQQVDLDHAYTRWRAQARTGPDGKLPLILVAAEGGGSRAGFWTGEVLSELHGETSGAFTKNLFAISSVSGASVGAVGYVAALRGNRDSAQALAETVRDFTGADALSPALAGLLSDLVQALLPIDLPGVPDRAETLELSWEIAWDSACGTRSDCRRGQMREPFTRLWDMAAPEWTPLVIINGAHQETGRAMLTSPVHLIRTEVDAFDFHSTVGRDVPASTAILNGARFAFISPAGLLTDQSQQRYGHIIDGGYVDPLGIDVARQLADAILSGPGKADEGQLQIIFVFIGYGTSSMKDDFRGPIAGTPSRTVGVDAAQDLVAPLIGLMQSRNSRDALIVSRLKENISRDARGSSFASYTPSGRGAYPNASYVPLLLCDNPDPDATSGRIAPLPVNWTLSNYSKSQMHKAVRRCGVNATLIDLLAATLGAASSTAAPGLSGPAPPTPAPAQPR